MTSSCTMGFNKQWSPPQKQKLTMMNNNTFPLPFFPPPTTNSLSHAQFWSK